MADFQKVLLEDVTENLDKLRVPLSSRVRQKLEKIYPYYGAQGIVDYVDDYLFDGEYLLVAEDGENLRSQNQNVCTLATGKFWVNNHAHILKEKDGNDLRYLYYLLNLVNFRPYVTGSAQPKLTQDSLNKIELSIHAPENQKGISSFLTALDSKIELNNRINAELEALAKTIYDYWFVQFDFPISTAQAAEMGNPELEGRPYKSSGGEMVWNEKLKREVPKGWGNCFLSEIGSVIGGSTPSKSKKEFFTDGGNGIPWITPKDLSVRKGKRFISYGEYDVTEAGRKSASLKIMPKGTVLLSSRAPVGYMAIAREPVTTNQGFKSLVPVNGFSTEYVFLTVELYLPAIIKKASGSTFAEISASTLKTVEIAAPTQELIEKFTTTVAPMFAKQDVLEQENQELASLRDWLLPMLMNGQVKVDEVKEYLQEDEVEIAAEEQWKYGNT